MTCAILYPYVRCCIPRALLSTTLQMELEPEGEAMPCHCGAKNCRGRMN